MLARFANEAPDDAKPPPEATLTIWGGPTTEAVDLKGEGERVRKKIRERDYIIQSRILCNGGDGDRSCC